MKEFPFCRPNATQGNTWYHGTFRPDYVKKTGTNYTIAYSKT
jgi:hypothetical protein